MDERRFEKPGLLGVGVWIVLSGILVPFVAAQSTPVKPGDDGTIELVIENDPASDFSAIEDVQVTVGAPTYFEVVGTSVRGPVTVQPGTTTTFLVNYRIKTEAPEGELRVNLELTQATSEVDWIPALDTSVPAWSVTFFVGVPPSIVLVDSNQEGNLRTQGPYSASTVTLDTRLWLHNGSTAPAGIQFIASSPSGISNLKVAGLDAAGNPDENKLFADLNVLSNSQDASFTDGTLPDATGYLVSATAGSTTTVYFGVDSAPPGLAFSLNVSPDFSVEAVGVSTDATSGVSETVFLSSWPLSGDQSRIGSGSPGPLSMDFRLPIAQQGWGAAGFVISRDIGGLAAAFNPVYISKEENLHPLGGAGQWSPAFSSQPASVVANRLLEYQVGGIGGCAHRNPLPAVCQGASPPPECTASAPTGACGSWSFKVRSAGYSQVSSVTVPIAIDGPFIGETELAGGALVSSVTFDVSGQPNLLLGASVEFLIDTTDGNDPYFTPGGGGSGWTSLNTLFITAAINPAAPVISTGIYPSVLVGDTQVFFGEVAAGPERRVWITQVPVSPPDGQRFLPNNTQLATDIATMASYTNGVHVRLRYNKGNLTDEQAAQIKMWHRGENGWENVTTFNDHQNSEIWGESATASPFAVLIPDAALGQAAAPSSVVRVTSATVSLTWPAGANPVGIRYFVAYTSSPANYPCSSPPGATLGAVSVFGESAEIGGLQPATGYRLQVCNDALGSEGCAVPVAVVTAQAGEPEQTAPAFLTCDGGQGSPDLTPPVTTLGFNGVFTSTTGAAGIINTHSSATLTAVDAGIGQVQIFYAVDPSTAVLAAGLSGGTTGAFSVYSTPFSLPAGRRVLAYGSVDGAGNFEALRSTEIVVESPVSTPADTAPPRTELHAENHSVFVDEALYVAGDSPLRFSTTDDRTVFEDGLGVGATQTFYATDTGAYALFTGTFSLVAEGTHTVSFFSVDLAGNAEAAQVRTVGVDLTPPSVILVSSGTAYALTADDPLIAGAASGVEGIQLVIDLSPDDCPDVEPDTAAVQGTCENPVYTAPFALAPGTHTIVFMAADRVGNEIVHSSFVTVGRPVTGPALTPLSGPIGIPFSIAGTGFGVYGGANTRVKFGTIAAPLSVWNDTQIKGTIPGLSTGVYAVAIERQNASSVTVVSGGNFTVTDLSAAALNVSSGPLGVPFTFSGTGFGPYAGTLTRVLVDGATAPLSVWNDTTITGTIPGVTPGAKAIVIQRSAGSMVSTSPDFNFEVTVPSVTAVSPSSAPIGAAFALTGRSFGPYAGTLTRVLIGGATAPLSLWNDTTIRGTVPGALTPGVQTVIVERRTSGGGLVQSGTAYFQVAGLAPSGIAPSSGPIGVPFTISGEGFGVYAGANTRVKFNGIAAPLSLWNDTTITGTVPALSTGAVEVVVERQQGADVAASPAGSFAVVELAPSSLTPLTGPIGTAFTITGAGFGPYAGTLTRVLIGGTTATLSLWNDTTITGIIPDLPAGSQPLWIERAAGAGVQSSATSYFEVTVPAVAAMTPSSAPIGAPFTITGTSFGAYAGTNTRVKFNGVAAPLSVWNDTQITGTVPALPAGVVDVIVERIQGTGSSASGAVPFMVLTPATDSLAPLSGPIGTAFTITGSGFGPYAGTLTRVLVGGTTAALSLWNDTTIKGTIPALPNGVQAVWLERSAGTGVQSSATSYFEVTAPAVAALTPSSAPIGAPFTITGTSFGAYAGANTRVKFNGLAAPLSVWNDTEIKGTVPGALPPGPAEVVVERAAGTGLTVSPAQAFFVLVPQISTIAPAYGPAGTVVTLTGSGFGPYAGTLTKLLVGGTTVPLSVWNDATIRWTVPASLGDGEYPVVVERSPAGGSVQSASATFTVGTGIGGASFAFAQTLSLAATPDTYFEGGMSLSSTTGGRIDTPAKAAVDIPANAMDADAEITLKRIQGDGLRSAAAEEAKVRAAGEPIEFGPEGTRFNTPVTIELPYDPALAGDESKIAIHYFNPLRREWEELPSVVDRARKVVSAKTDHFSIYQPMGLAPATAAQDEFYFRDAYAFPNPSRSGALVTFRIQPGLADTVEVRVYDLSGRKIHASSDFTYRGAIDDGNGKGAQNTYDHVWSVSGVGSGVYHFVIKASRAGNKPITKSGKVGVIK